MFKITSLLAGALLAAGAAQAQTTGTQFGLKAGLTNAVLDGTINTGAEPKNGFHLGGFVRWRPSARFALQPELVYAQQGCDTRVVNTVPFEGQIKLNYLNVPILAKVYLGKVFNLQAGPQIGFLLGAQREGQVMYSTVSGYKSEKVDVRDDYKNDLALCGGLGADLPFGLIVAARINYGLTDIDKNPVTRAIRDSDSIIGGLHNRSLEFSLGYAFGGK
ncbi:porin family protein [Hymenobacter edaphi]|nr:porin family protein [Hymenobacter edaphi]